jgi:hypothetical protein
VARTPPSGLIENQDSDDPRPPSRHLVSALPPGELQLSSRQPIARIPAAKRRARIEPFAALTNNR